MTIAISRIKPPKTVIFAALAVVTLVAGAYSLLPRFFSSAAPADLAYFQGKWSVTLKGDTGPGYTWTVVDDLKGEWLTGVVEKGNERVSTDHWRINAGLVERYVFTSEGVSVKLVSSGWKAGKMIFNGIANGKAADFRMRTTITKETESRFKSVWEKQGDDGKWGIYAEETLSK